jgi:hypothetical protein
LTAQYLLGGRQFKSSDKPWDWLGNGAYFWEADIVRAYEWARERRAGSPCVVGAAIDLGNCLDLTTRTGILAAKAAYKSFAELQATRGQSLPVNRAAPSGKPSDVGLRLLDRAVIDHLHSLYQSASENDGGKTKEFDTVRAMFGEGDPIYDNSGFKEKTLVQISVRKIEQILGVFRVPVWQLAELNLPLDIYSKL